MAIPEPERCLSIARAVAREAHEGQPYGDFEYIHAHVAVVARGARPFGPWFEALAWLHDVVEDTAFTLDSLRALNLPDHLVDDVDAITYRKGIETRDEYYQRVIARPRPLVVKMIDVLANEGSLPTLELTDPAKAERLYVKYAHTKQALGMVP